MTEESQRKKKHLSQPIENMYTKGTGLSFTFTGQCKTVTKQPKQLGLKVTIAVRPELVLQCGDSCHLSRPEYREMDCLLSRVS